MSEKFMSRFADCEYTISIDGFCDPGEYKNFTRAVNEIEHWKYAMLWDVEFYEVHNVIYFGNLMFQNEPGLYYILPANVFEWCLINNRNPLEIWLNFTYEEIATLTFEEFIDQIAIREKDVTKWTTVKEYYDVLCYDSEYWEGVAKYYGCDSDNTEDILVKSYN